MKKREDESCAEQRKYIMSLLANEQEYDKKPAKEEAILKKKDAEMTLSSILKKVKK